MNPTGSKNYPHRSKVVSFEEYRQIQAIKKMGYRLHRDVAGNIQFILRIREHKGILDKLW